MALGAAPQAFYQPPRRMTDVVLKAQDVSKSYWEGDKEIKVLDEVSFEVERGEFLAITGPSGCGKSTLLRIIAGLIGPDQGRVVIDGKPPLQARHQLAMVFQDFALFGWLTNLGNVEFGLRMRGMPHNEAKRLARQKMKLMGLASYEEHFPGELSIGMRQRVGFARALAVDPEVLIMDEPFSALDAYTAATLRKELLGIWRKQNEKEPGNMTVIMVTHLADEAAELADRILVSTPRPARVERIFANTLPRPRNKRSEEFYRLVDSITQYVAPTK